MEKKKWSRIMIGTLLVLVLAIGGTAVFAQTQSQDDPTAIPPANDGSTDSTTPALPNPFSRGHHPDFNGRGSDVHTDTYLADALGITVEELQAAQEAANTAALDQAVADGLITQEQADQMAQFGGRFLHDGHFGLVNNMDELLANELGISVEALQTARQEAEAAKLAQMVADGVLTQEQADMMSAHQAVESHMDYEGLNAAVQEAYATAVQAALDAGEITQAQADQLLSEAASAPGIGHFGFDGPGGFGGRGHGGPGGHGGHGFPGAMPGSGSNTTTSNSNA